jgi:hypothetical protein
MIEEYHYKIMSDLIIIIIGDDSNELKCKCIFIKRESKLGYFQTFTNALKVCDSEEHYYINEVRKEVMYNFNILRCDIM